MNVAGLITQLKSQLQSLSSPRLEAERMVAHVVDVSTSQLIQHERDIVPEEKLKWLKEAVERRLKGEPLAYILETQGFFKSDFIVRKGVLVPRPETEIVVESALRIFSSKLPEKFADLGCGTGCIGLSLLREWNTTSLLAVDASETAVKITKENAIKLGLQNRCEIRHSAVEKLDFKNHFELVVANPPYIAPDDSLVEPNVKKFEPHEALFAGENGLAALHSWSAWAKTALKPGGWWITEIGASQKEELSAKLLELGFSNLGFKKDLAGHDRVICAQKI